MQAGIKRKLHELFKLIDADTVLIANTSLEQPYFYYFTQLPYGKFSGNVLLLKRHSKPLIISNVLQADMVSAYGWNVVSADTKKEFFELLRENIEGKQLGINYAEINMAFFKKLKKELKVKLFDVRAHLEKLRETKTVQEIKLIKRACAIAERLLEGIPNLFVRGMTENELANLLEIEIKLLGLEPAFPVIVASSKHAKIPHYLPQNIKIKKGFLLVDLGVRYRNYCSDLCRTFYFGRAKQKDKTLYETVFSAKEIVENNMKAGIEARKLFNSANDFLRKAGFTMVHALGHGIGLQEHDFPQVISSKCGFTLKEDMCLAIEPAIYGSFGGVRIEDNYVVKKNRIQKLSQASSELIEFS
jgi:Xaa-Pro aminopeptidase